MPPRIYRYDAGRDTVEDAAWWPPPPVDAGNLEAHDVHVSSHDGTRIPLSIIHKKNLARDGTNPTLLQGYGSHGIALTPAFSAPLLAWYERGGILAVAHVRGGGEYGAQWHEAGRKLNKQKGVDDFIACAEYLIARGYTRPGCLASEGRSAGGLLVGNALVQRPDLWAAGILEVPVVNVLRFEVTQAGVGNVSEFGSVATEEGFRALYQMDAYTQVRDGVAYPAVLLTTGRKDLSAVGQAAKMAARLQAATTSGKPVLLRVEVQGGHGFANPELLADKLAFLLSQCG
jgi:prolyl oligopeptidase